MGMGNISIGSVSKIFSRNRKLVAVWGLERSLFTIVYLLVKCVEVFL